MKKFFVDLGYFVLASVIAIVYMFGGVSFAHHMRSEYVFIGVMLGYIILLGPALTEFFRNKCIMKDSGKFFTGFCIFFEAIIAFVIWQVNPYLAVLQVVSRMIHVGFYLTNKYVGWKKAMREQAIFNAVTFAFNVFLSTNVFTVWVLFVTMYYGRRIYKRKEIFNIA
jgi:hypothetical protein